MARRSSGDISALIILIGFLFLAPIYFIIWIVKAINKNKELKVYSATNQTNKVHNQDKIMNVFNEEKAIRDSKIKIKEISEDKKTNYSLKRKKYLKSTHITLSSLFVLFAFLMLLAYTGNSEETTFIIFFSVFIIISILFIITLMVKLKKSSSVFALKQIENDLKKAYRLMTIEKYSNMQHNVIRISKLYKSIVDLNNRYNFNYTECGKHTYNFIAKSKQGVENYNFDKSLFAIIIDESLFYNKIQSIFEENFKLYKQYEIEYSNLKSFLSRSDYEKLKVNIEYEFYNYIEKDLYQSKKLKPINSPSVEIMVEYTSPTGRNYYKNNYLYTYNELIQNIEYIKSQKELELLEKERKAKALEEKKQKEKRLKELDKLEMQLKEKEQIINAKEIEFKEATKGHIYSAEAIIIENDNLIENEESQYQKLKRLKRQFENGKITREEYNQKRNDLL